MTMYIKLSNDIPERYSVTQLRRDIPQTSLPKNPSDELLAEFGVYPLAATPEPEHDNSTQQVVEDTPALVDGMWRQAWKVIDLTQEELASKAAQLREEAKANRQAAVEAITVTTSSGKTFDGDETSQTRMARAILALQATGTPSITWVLADNTVTEATVAELSEAMALAGAEQAGLWVL